MAGESQSTFFGLSSVDDWRKKSGVTCSFVIFAALNIAMVWIGADAIYQCPIEPMVPTYLVGELGLKMQLYYLVRLRGWGHWLGGGSDSVS